MPPKGSSEKDDGNKNKNSNTDDTSPPPGTRSDQHDASRDGLPIGVKAKGSPSQMGSLRETMVQSVRGEAAPNTSGIGDTLLSANERSLYTSPELPGSRLYPTTNLLNSSSISGDLDETSQLPKDENSPIPTQAASTGTSHEVTPSPLDQIGDDSQLSRNETSLPGPNYAKSHDMSHAESQASFGRVSEYTEAAKSDGPSSNPVLGASSDLSHGISPNSFSTGRLNTAPYPAPHNAHQIPQTPEECIEWLLKWAMNEGMEGTLTTAIGPELACHLVTFNLEAVQSDDLSPAVASFGSTPSLSSSLADMRSEAWHQIFAKRVRDWLKTPGQAKMKEETEKLIDQKLKEVSIDGEKIDESWSFDQKVGHLAGRQNMRQLEASFTIDGDPSDNIYTPMPMQSQVSKHGEFQVHLRYVVDGDAKNTQVRVLYFDFHTPFYEFAKSLQEFTAQCVIPPLDSLNVFMKEIFVKKREPEGEHESTTGPSDQTPRPATQPSYRIIHTEEEGGLKYTYYQGYMGPREPSNDRERGYTMADGPWKCERALLAQAKNTIPTRALEWTKQIANEKDYTAMIRELYDTNKAARDAADPPQSMLRPRGFFQEDDDPDTTYVLCIMHSMDYAEFLKYEKRKEIEKKADEKSDAEWTKSMPDIKPLQRWSEWVDECNAKGVDPYANVFGNNKSR
ncbi:hypothetical protein HYFRA_00001818 [Hymenoscyphus fraxineus]|uniref:Uncharacterized protein n=1 Tax=Hymenoscyphus fraxineus TaxID=746836 RepID=A0A9N9PNS9_9HELO|nr:hypothetical protein HYFRA_00001818 [Hymenoscyphus fraxineus]